MAALVLQETDRAVGQLISLSREPIALSSVRCLISHRLAWLKDPSPVLIKASHRLARESLRVDKPSFATAAIAAEVAWEEAREEAAYNQQV